MWHDRSGTEISTKEANDLLGNIDYKVIALREVGDTRISTVWLGLDHGWTAAPPLIFETMVFRNGDSIDMERYATEAEARLGHDRMVDKYFNTDLIFE